MSRRNGNENVARPVRTCIGCAAKKNKWDLLRLSVDVNGRVVKDPDQTRPGRGAYVCPGPDCMALAAKKKKFYRAFKGPVTVEASLFDDPPGAHKGFSTVTGSDRGLDSGRS